MAEDGLIEVYTALAVGADVNYKDGNSMTSLMYASRNGHTEVVNILLMKAKVTSMLEMKWKTALMWAAKLRGHGRGCECFIEKRYIN